MKQYMLIGLPSSGSDWLSSVIRAVNPLLRCDSVAKEYFNPICNPARFQPLVQAFGCELAQTQRFITDSLWHDHARTIADDAYTLSWGRDGLNFTKEVFSSFRIQYFSQKFQLLGLMRAAEYTFPAKRLRVLNWYDAIWQSLVLQQRVWGWQQDPMVATMLDHGHEFAKRSLLFRAVAAHTIARRVALRDFAAHGIACLHWKHLMTYRDTELVDYVRERLPAELQPEQVARELEETRLSSAQELRRRSSEFHRSGAYIVTNKLEQIADGYTAKT